MLKKVVFLSIVINIVILAQLVLAETAKIMDLPPLPEGTVLFEEEKMFGYRGRLGGFALPPSKIGIIFDLKVFYEGGEPEFLPESLDESQSKPELKIKSIKIMYKKETKDLSFCGAYIILLADLRKCQTLTFMIKGKDGGEVFEIGANDTISNKREDAVYLGSVYRYLPNGITKDWQMVKIPLSDFYGPDMSKIYSLVFEFTEAGKGTFWIDQIRFHTEAMVDRESEIKGKGYLLLDDFDHSLVNLLGNKTNAYKRLPSECAYELSAEEKYSGQKSLKLTFDKKGSGWCGYYTLLNQIDGDYYDLTLYKSVSFMVKGKEGSETFEIGMADKNWSIIGDSLKAGPVEKYLPGGVTKEWQEVNIPLKNFGALDLIEMSSFVINFYKSSKGVIYIDDLKFYRKTEEDVLKEWDQGG
ncbi:MAG: hypothetical protein COS99_01615 [Candidatus Omnitrophica bacterium CG07_land_8_20_14_0_80_42_15]|uniref:Carbohydrate binding domain-containing protein n=1 Tax=Candidatus Aquitaenariimonas noxiae TaxID=1974741 RepID=A0A2J0KUM7_9BACT|nr:MAG: hypothetical protein COS99_01615 [Candidatus Omnitrophica bacterium CG07_land_8_20_14_0_80_42_15]